MIRLSATFDEWIDSGREKLLHVRNTKAGVPRARLRRQPVHSFAGSQGLVRQKIEVGRVRWDV